MISCYSFMQHAQPTGPTSWPNTKYLKEQRSNEVHMMLNKILWRKHVRAENVMMRTSSIHTHTDTHKTHLWDVTTKSKRVRVVIPVGDRPSWPDLQPYQILSKISKGVWVTECTNICLRTNGRKADRCIPQSLLAMRRYKSNLALLGRSARYPRIISSV